MKSSLHPTSIDDLDVLSEFDAGPGAPLLNPAVMTGIYWDRRDDWSGPRSYVLLRDGAIVAHAGIWPIPYRTGADALRGVHMIDWASAKDSPGAGLALVQKLAAMFDFIVSIGGSEMTCKVLPAFGFVECTRVERRAPASAATADSDSPEPQLETRTQAHPKLVVDDAERHEFK